MFKLKHRSSFTDAPARNPFWPIGWVKGDTTQAEVQDAVPITADKFEVTSISTGSNPLAVINGKTYAEGETIIALYDDQKIKIQVVAINDGDVVLNISAKIRHPVETSRIVAQAGRQRRHAAQEGRQHPYSALSWRRIPGSRTSAQSPFNSSARTFLPLRARASMASVSSYSPRTERSSFAAKSKIEGRNV